MCIYIYICHTYYIYIEREIDRKMDRETERYTCVNIYIYMCSLMVHVYI